MGKKDCQTSRLPVDHYRKQIGKQNRKHTTPDVKKIRKQQEMKRKTTKVYKDVKVIVSGFLGAAVLVYAAMLLWFHVTEGYSQ